MLYRGPEIRELNSKARRKCFSAAILFPSSRAHSPALVMAIYEV